MKRIDPLEASRILAACKINPFVPFHTLSSSAVSELLEYADKCKYRKPKNANGSRGRYFHAYLIRQLGKDE